MGQPSKPMEPPGRRRAGSTAAPASRPRSTSRHSPSHATNEGSIGSAAVRTESGREYTRPASTARTNAASPTTSTPATSVQATGPKLCIVCKKAKARLPGDKPLECQRCKRICHRGCLDSRPATDVWWCPRCEKREKERRNSTPLSTKPRLSSGASSVRTNEHVRGKRKSEPTRSSARSGSPPASNIPVDKDHRSGRDPYVENIGDPKGTEKTTTMQKYQESLPAGYDGHDPKHERKELKETVTRKENNAPSTRKLDQKPPSEGPAKSKTDHQTSLQLATGALKRGISLPTTPETKKQKLSPKISRKVTPQAPEHEPLVGSPCEIEEDSVKVKREGMEDDETEERKQDAIPDLASDYAEKFKQGMAFLLPIKYMKILVEMQQQKDCILRVPRQPPPKK
ncbi:hypothetical protein TWF696_000693 [Orbilia brochopaga]|uniref:Zinc finger PHD-type domain-containing protein n=1 Tax=Orbilia brochopaga TaxID=3140254 RepID=A0AAV9VEE0_9PEZI